MSLAWDPKNDAELDRLLALRQPLEEAKVASLSPSDRDRYQGFVRATSDVLTIFFVYMDGFARLQRADPATLSVHGHVLHWLHQNAGRSPQRIAGMIATNLCSTLEEFVTAVATSKLTPAVILGLPRAFVRSMHVKGRDTRELRKAILKAVKPAVRSDGEKWIAALSAVFSINLDAATRDSLLSMIHFRNAYVHEPAKAMGVTVTPDEVFSWPKAVLLLAHDLALQP